MARVPVKRVLVDLGGCIRATRIACGLTQEEAADVAKIDVKRWQRLEAGDVNPTVRTLTRVAAALGTDFWGLIAARRK